MNIRVPAMLPKWNGIMYDKGRGGHGMGGLGQDDTGDSGTIGYTGGDTNTGTDLTDLPLYVATPNYAGSSVVTGNGSGINNSSLTASTLQQLIQGGLQIGKITAAQNTPAGQQLLYNAQGQLISASTEPAGVPLGTTAASATIGGLSVTTLMLLALAAFAVMQMGRH